MVWISCFQQCRGTGWCPQSEELQIEAAKSGTIALSSAESEVYAASHTLKQALHHNYVCKEIGIPCDDNISINVDAGAAIGFINNTGCGSRLKHINMQEKWVSELQNRKLATFKKVAGTENEADFFTKVVTLTEFKKAMERLMPMKSDPGSMQ